MQSVMPGFVTTKMSKLRRASWLIPNPQTYVRSALATLGAADRTPGYLAHSLQVSESSLIRIQITLTITHLLDFNAE